MRKGEKVYFSFSQLLLFQLCFLKIALILVGVPSLMLELAVGQKMQQGAIGSYQKLHSSFGGLGLLALISSFILFLIVKMKILLIHGLSRTPLSLLGLEWYLQQAGWKTEQFGYMAVAETFERIVERLRVRLQILSSQGSYGIIAHSLGGLLTRAALGLGSIQLPQHIVMLGTPNQPPRLAPHAWRLPPFRWWTGQCGLNLTNPAFFASLPGIESPYTIVAGTGGPRGFWSPFGDELNDGIVALSETRLSHQDPIVQLPVMHTFMMNDSSVQKTVGRAFGLKSKMA